MSLVILDGILLMSVSYFFREVNFGEELKKLTFRAFREDFKKDVSAPYT